ncbi:hypothetical protein ABZ934_25775 [Streptomyces sp. NPDC046557]|uniref:hypothetical protein n=1 Tax=Streptomyces sp. NPDC046557 TaxID=3155372 RepID=UPI0033D312E7
MDGVLAIESDDRTHSAPRGTFALLPRGVPHALRRASDPPQRVLQDLLPGRLGVLRRGPGRGGLRSPDRWRTGPRQDEPPSRPDTTSTTRSGVPEDPLSMSDPLSVPGV